MKITPEQLFEQWYVENAFDYVANPIGSRDCGLQRAAFAAGTAAQLERITKGVEMPEPAYRAKPYSSLPIAAVSAAVDYYTADQLRSTVAAAVEKKDAEIVDLKMKVVTLWAERHPASEVAELKAENERLREALEQLAKLGNGDRYGNSIGNEIAQAALKGQP